MNESEKATFHFPKLPKAGTHRTVILMAGRNALALRNTLATVAHLLHRNQLCVFLEHKRWKDSGQEKKTHTHVHTHARTYTHRVENRVEVREKRD